MYLKQRSLCSGAFSFIPFLLAPSALAFFARAICGLTATTKWCPKRLDESNVVSLPCVFLSVFTPTFCMLPDNGSQNNVASRPNTNYTRV